MGKKSGQKRTTWKGGSSEGERQRQQRLQEQQRMTQEALAIERMQKEVPSPEEMDAALERVRKATSITFEVYLGGSWRTVWFTEARPLPNQVKPDLTILFFKPVLVISTAYLPSIEGYLAVSLHSLVTEKVTLLPLPKEELSLEALLSGIRYGRTLGFRPANEESRDWLRLCFARAMGMKFREHSFLDPSKIVYTARP